jgi:glycosyltransferase involved in cell wall biosynthesis
MVDIRQNSITSNKSIHVLHIASGDLWAGAEVMLYTLAKSLYKELNTQVSIVLLNHGILEQRLSNCGISVHVLDESRLSSFQILQQLNKTIDKLKPDVIHTHRIKENIIGSIAALYNHRIPSLRTVHGAPEHRPPLHQLPKHLILFLNWLFGRFYQRYIIAVSPDLAKKLEHDFPKTRIRVIENGVDIDTLTHHISHSQSKNTDKTGYRIGIAGRLVPVKRVDLFIESAFYLKQHHPELSIHFHIYGDGPLSDNLQAQVRSQQAEDYIHFEGHCENIAQHLGTLDALLMTSDHEGLPMVLLEAMCLKIPIIAHAVGGIPHLLDQGRCGVLVQNQTAKAFAEAIVKLINQPEQYEQLAQLALERVNHNYSASSTADAYLKVYKILSAWEPPIHN